MSRSDGGHALDFVNKALETLDVAGWDLAEPVLSSLARGLADASRMEESNAWRHPVDLVIMAGFLRRWIFPAAYEGRVLNIHPALLPKYGGKGYYGHHVHEAVLKAGEKESGCTVHFADHHYDRGPILVQKRVPVLPGDTPDTLAARVFEAECEAYPEAIELVASGRVRIEGRRAIIDG